MLLFYIELPDLFSKEVLLKCSRRVEALACVIDLVIINEKIILKLFSSGWHQNEYDCMPRKNCL